MEIKTIASGSSGNCYLIDDGETRLLIEAGIQFKRIQRALEFDLQGVAACLVSHSHFDHCKAVKDLLKASIDCYMNHATAEALGVSSHHRAMIVEPLQRFMVGSWAILPFDTVHDVPNMGFLLANKAGEKLIYLTDTPYCKYTFSGLTHILVEANYSIDMLKENKDLDSEVKKRVIRNHFSLENVKGFLRSNDLSKVQEIWLLHLSEKNSHEQRFKAEVQAMAGKPTYVVGGETIL